VTPRERAIAALRRQVPEGVVPHLELEFQLSEEVFGQRALRGEDLKEVGGAKRQDLLKRNAEHWVEVARRFDYAVLTGLHWLPLEDQLASFGYVREIAGDTYMLSGFVDGTFGIPSGKDMVEHVVWLTEHSEEARAEAERRCDHSIESGLKLIEGGAEILLMCADYCFNDGPFLSPKMFREWVTPFLTKQVAAWKRAGAFVCKHTDGQIMPILDQMVESGIDALHSLDPMAGVDIAQVKRLYGDRICLIGNVNLADLQMGDRARVERSARYCLEHGGVRQGGYIFATSNCIFKGVPFEMYEFMLDLRQRWGTPEAWEGAA
jgi:uroporphyrinogen decarboxylase